MTLLLVTPILKRRHRKTKHRLTTLIHNNRLSEDSNLKLSSSAVGSQYQVGTLHQQSELTGGIQSRASRIGPTNYVKCNREVLMSPGVPNETQFGFSVLISIPRVIRQDQTNKKK